MKRIITVVLGMALVCIALAYCIEVSNVYGIVLEGAGLVLCFINYYNMTK